MASVSEYISQGRTYLGEVTTELKKVYWPARNETLAFTGVVIVVVSFVAAYLGIVDFVLSRILGLLF
jgi:preprotein translocase subunit SecE